MPHRPPASDVDRFGVVAESGSELFELSVVIPAHNEAANLEALIHEVGSSVRDAGIDAELIVVDDGSEDQTWPLLESAAGEHAWVRGLRLSERRGQSYALWVGIGAARAGVVATLDADGQNDPADLPTMLARLRRDGLDLVQGFREHRQDHRIKKLGSAVGRWARRVVLADPVRDTGCSTRVATAALARRWPLHLAGMHRFLPAYSAMLGAALAEVPVQHRPRRAGVSHYGSLRRGLTGGLDLLAVRWMMSRHRRRPGLRETRIDENAKPSDRGTGAVAVEEAA